MTTSAAPATLDRSPVQVPMIGPAVARDLCTDCGISRTADARRCGRACQFIKPDYPGLEARVHGRSRDPAKADELFFGPFRRMLRASIVRPLDGAQWTGITTRVAERLFVIGTPCSDNTTTENFHKFLCLLADDPDTITYLEFCADYHVELRFSDGRVKTIPFLQLPLSTLPNDFFPLTCRTCVDYSNVLADITVGYMGGQGEQWLLVRNERGEELLDLLGDEVRTTEPGSAGKRQSAVKGFLANVERAAGGLPLRKMPDWLRPIVGWLMPKIGPRGIEVARTRVEMKALETVAHLRRERPRRLRHMVPAHVWTLVRPYGLEPKEDEIK